MNKEPIALRIRARAGVVWRRSRAPEVLAAGAAALAGRVISLVAGPSPAAGAVSAPDAFLRASIATNVFVGTMGAVAAVAVYYIFRYIRFARIGAGQAPPIPEFKSSPYEQILAELQGINLSMMSDDGRGDYFKLARLVRAFLRRAGVPNATKIQMEDLRAALTLAQFSTKHIRMLTSILERCETAMHPPPGRKVEIDPMDLIRDFRYIVHQFEGREG